MTGTIAGVCGVVLILIMVLYIQALNKKEQRRMQRQLSYYEKMLEIERNHEKMYKTFTQKLGS